MESRDNFLMDFENACIPRWDSSIRPHPIGPFRWQDTAWAEMMRLSCENNSDVTFEQYCDWCRQGGGDEWFQKANFYDTYQAEFPGELQVELQENQRLRDVYATRLEMLMQRNPVLQLVREGRSDLYREYEMHFNDKIHHFTENVVALKRRVAEQP